MLTKKTYICSKCNHKEIKETNHDMFFRCEKCKEEINWNNLNNSILNKKLIDVTNKDLYESYMPDSYGSFLMTYVEDKMNLSFEKIEKEMELREVFIDYKKSNEKYGYLIPQTKKGFEIFNKFKENQKKEFSMFPKSITITNQKIYFKKQISSEEKDIIEVIIRWDDSCYNGGNSFSITANYPYKQEYGCLHKRIEKEYKDLSHLIKFHGISIYGFKRFFSDTNYIYKTKGVEKAIEFGLLNKTTKEENIKNEDFMLNHYKDILNSLKIEIEKLGLIF